MTKEEKLIQGLNEIISMTDPERKLTSTVMNWDSYEAGLRDAARVARKTLKESHDD